MRALRRMSAGLIPQCKNTAPDNVGNGYIRSKKCGTHVCVPYVTLSVIYNTV